MNSAVLLRSVPPLLQMPTKMIPQALKQCKPQILSISTPPTAPKNSSR